MRHQSAAAATRHYCTGSVRRAEGLRRPERAAPAARPHRRLRAAESTQLAANRAIGFHRSVFQGRAQAAGHPGLLLRGARRGRRGRGPGRGHSDTRPQHRRLGGARVGRRPGRAARQALRDAGHAAQRAPGGPVLEHRPDERFTEIRQRELPAGPVIPRASRARPRRPPRSATSSSSTCGTKSSTEPAARALVSCRPTWRLSGKNPFGAKATASSPWRRPVRKSTSASAGLEVFTILAASKQASAWRPRTRRLSLARTLDFRTGDGLLADCPSIEVDCHHSDFVPTARLDPPAGRPRPRRPPPSMPGRRLVTTRNAASSAGRRRRPSRGPARRLWTPSS